MKAHIQILLVEDSPQFREVVAYGIEDESDMAVVGKFNTAESALRSLADDDTKIVPDVILLDLSLPGISGLESIPRLKELCPQVEILVLTQSNKETDIVDAISHGAVGYLLKESSMMDIIEGIRTIVQGGASLDPVMARYLISKQKGRSAILENKDTNLSTRELEVLNLLAKGRVQKQIADELSVSPKTVGFHIGHIYLKLEVKNAPEAIHKAHQLGLFQ